MKKVIFASLCAAALATSCSSDLSVDGKHTVQLDACVSAESSRAAFLSSGAFYWQSGDQIGVITIGNENAVSTTFSPLDLKTGDKTASASFEGTISGSLGGYAIYPYDQAQKIADGTLTYTFPASYTYTKVDQTFFPEAQDGNSFRPAMLASISGNSVAFKHLGAVFCIEVEKMPCAEGTITLTTDQKLCGEFTTSTSGTTPELKTESTTVTTGNAVTINFSGATSGSTGVFYVPAPTGVYTNAKVTITPKDGTAKEIFAGKFTMERTNLYRLALKTVTVDATTESTVENVSSVEAELLKSDNVAVKGEVTGTATVSIPAVTGSSSTTTTTAKTVTLQKVADNASITVEDKNSSTEESATTSSVKELTVSIPNNSDADKAPTVTVSMPNTTVTLAGNAGTATYKEVTASTAENTLVVSDGVTVKKLIVKKGNVRINKGATVETIELSDISSAKVYYENGATLPSSLPTGVTSSGVIETEAQIAAALTNGGNYALLKDVKISDYKTTGMLKTIVIDLNKHTLNMDLRFECTAQGDLTLKNGNITQYTSSNDDGGFIVYSLGKLTLENVVYTGRANSWDCIFIKPNAMYAKIVVKNSTIKGGTYAITTNASTSPNIAQYCTIDMEGSTFAASESGALLNIPADVTMKNCKFSGDHQGAFLRGGTYTIEGCEFTLNTIDPACDKGKENHWMTEWSSGNEGAFAALTIGNYINGSYQYPTKITFNKSGDKSNTTAVTGSYAASYPAIHVCANANAEYGVTITGMSNITTPSSGCKTPAIEYGTSNITVDNTTPSVNCNTNN